MVYEGEVWDEVDTASPGRYGNTGHCVTYDVKSNMVLVAGRSGRRLDNVDSKGFLMLKYRSAANSES